MEDENIVERKRFIIQEIKEDAIGLTADIGALAIRTLVVGLGGLGIAIGVETAQNGGILISMLSGVIVGFGLAMPSLGYGGSENYLDNIFDIKMWAESLAENIKNLKNINKNDKNIGRRM